MFDGPSPSGQPDAAYLQLRRGAVTVRWTTIDGARPGPLACSPVPVPNCVLVVASGAHASLGLPIVRRGDRLVQLPNGEADTPGSSAADLDGDGWIDLVGLQDTYQPDYATGRVYWQTWRGSDRGLVSTGCTGVTPPAQRPEQPSQLLTGECIVH